MLHTNLLPQEEKRVIAQEQWLRAIRFFGVSLSAILCCGITLLAPSYLPIYFQNRELQHALSVQKEAEQKIDADTIVAAAFRVQAIISSLRQSTGNSGNALRLFDLLTVPQTGISIDGFSVDKGGNVSIEGHARARDDLLAFEQYLRDSSRFQTLASPLANIIQEADITFAFKGALKQNYGL